LLVDLVCLLDFSLEFAILFLEGVDVSGKLVHIVVKRVILFFGFDESVCDFFESVDSAFFFDVIEGLFDHFHVTFVLLNHF